jgi:hypothetical protein
MEIREACEFDQEITERSGSEDMRCITSCMITVGVEMIIINTVTLEAKITVSGEEKSQQKG